MFTINHKVHLGDTDATGQVYYAKPLEWLEWCRVDWFESLYGNFLTYVQKYQLTYFPAKIQVDYKKPIFCGDNLSIRMHTADLKKVSCQFNYVVERQGETVLTAEVTMVCYHHGEKRLARIPDHMIESINSLVPIHG